MRPGLVGSFCPNRVMGNCRVGGSPYHFLWFSVVGVSNVPAARTENLWNPSDTSTQNFFMPRAQTLKGATTLYSELDSNRELKNIVIDLVGSECPTFEEFLRSLRGFLL